MAKTMTQKQYRATTAAYLFKILVVFTIQFPFSAQAAPLTEAWQRCIQVLMPSSRTVAPDDKRIDHILNTPNNPDHGFEVLVPDLNGMTIKYANSYEEAAKIASTIPADQVINWSRVLANLDHFYDKTVAQFKSQLPKNVRVEHRLKDEQSAKEKVFKKAREAKAFGEGFNISHIYDMVGIRFIFRHYANYKMFAEHPELFLNKFGFASNALINVKLKGLEPQEGKPQYRAVHYILSEGFFNFEVQVMSELMKMWHAWDHNRVYKPELSGRELQRLKSYSIILSETLVAIENCQLPISTYTQFRTYIKSKFPVHSISKKDRLKHSIDVTIFENLLLENRELCKKAKKEGLEN